MTATPAYYSTSVLTKQPPIAIEEQPINPLEVQRAWKEQIKACDWYESQALRDQPNEDVCERAHEAMIEATEYADQLQQLYNDQCNRRVYNADLTWFIVPRCAEAKIKNSWYQVEVIKTVGVGSPGAIPSSWFVQVRALPIQVDGKDWQPRPFSQPVGLSTDTRYIFRGAKDNVAAGMVPLENIRVNGKRLGVK